MLKKTISIPTTGFVKKDQLKSFDAAKKTDLSSADIVVCKIKRLLQSAISEDIFSQVACKVLCNAQKVFQAIQKKVSPMAKLSYAAAGRMMW